MTAIKIIVAICCNKSRQPALANCFAVSPVRCKTRVSVTFLSFRADVPQGIDRWPIAGRKGRRATKNSSHPVCFLPRHANRNRRDKAF